MMFNSSEIIKEVTLDVIASFSSSTLPDERTCAEKVLEEIVIQFDLENSIRPKGHKMKKPITLPVLSAAILISSRKDLALIAPGNKSQAGKKRTYSVEQKMVLPVGMYQTDGDNKGIWEITNGYRGAFGELVERYKPEATLKEKKEIFELVKSKLRVVEKCVIPYYVAVNNGIVDVQGKKLLPFSPDIVFTAKIHTNLNLCATNPFINIPEDGSVWDVDSWLLTLGDTEFVGSITEVIQAACLPLAPRNKMCLFYNKSGNNGKGTICQLIRNLLGDEVIANIPIKEFDSRFGLARLPGAMAVIVDENDVSSFNQGLGKLKAVITGDKVSIERKYENSYDFSWNGLIIQCVNDFPNGDDKTSSFRRRLHIITFENCFSGSEKKYIKDRLIYREDVLEYVLKMVLVDMDYRDSFTETEATKSALEQYVLETNSVADFLEEILPECQWDLLPGTDFLYEAYKYWHKKSRPSGRVIGRNDFFDSVRSYVSADIGAGADWEWTDSTLTKGYIDESVPEPLLMEYEIMGLLNPRYPNRMYPCNLKTKYSGLKRRNRCANPQETDNEKTS